MYIESLTAVLLTIHYRKSQSIKSNEIKFICDTKIQSDAMKKVK